MIHLALCSGPLNAQSGICINWPERLCQIFNLSDVSKEESHGILKSVVAAGLNVLLELVISHHLLSYHSTLWNLSVLSSFFFFMLCVCVFNPWYLWVCLDRVWFTEGSHFSDENILRNDFQGMFSGVLWLDFSWLFGPLACQASVLSGLRKHQQSSCQCLWVPV